MKQSDYLAHSDLEAQAMRREALRRAMLNRPPVRAQRGEPSHEGSKCNPWGRCFTVAFALVTALALGVVALDVFLWRP